MEVEVEVELRGHAVMKPRYIGKVANMVLSLCAGRMIGIGLGHHVTSVHTGKVNVLCEVGGKGW